MGRLKPSLFVELGQNIYQRIQAQYVIVQVLTCVEYRSVSSSGRSKKSSLVIAKVVTIAFQSFQSDSDI